MVDMKRIFGGLLLVLLSLQGCATTQGEVSPQSEPTPQIVPEAVETGHPEVYLRHGYVLDMVCLGDQIPEGLAGWSAEMVEELDEFQQKWDDSGKPLLKGTVELFDKPFARKEMIATILLCNRWVPMGAPVIIPIWRFLDTASQEAGLEPLDRDMFVAAVFHEFLHIYIEDNFFPQVRASEIARELGAAGEPFMAIAHVHLAAIMTKVYTNQGQQDLLERVIALEKTYSPAYERAWEIVAERGPDVFLKELGLK